MINTETISAYHQVYDEESRVSMESTIASAVITRFQEGAREYRPDYSTIETMQFIQVELALNGIATTLSSAYRRGDAEPITHILRRKTPGTTLRLIKGDQPLDS